MNLPIAGFGSLTMKRRRQSKGLESDECFWIAHEHLVRDMKRYSPRRDPPPDLVVEVEVSRSALNRIGIYAALKVPEVWRFDGERLEFLALGENDLYVSSLHSLTFPNVTPADVFRFLKLRGSIDQNGIVRQFREWIRSKVESGNGNATKDAN